MIIHCPQQKMYTAKHNTSPHILTATACATCAKELWDQIKPPLSVTHLAAGRKHASLNNMWLWVKSPVPPVNIPIPTQIGSKMGGAPFPKWDTIGFEPWPCAKTAAALCSARLQLLKLHGLRAFRQALEGADRLRSASWESRKQRRQGRVLPLPKQGWLIETKWVQTFRKNTAWHPKPHLQE